MRNKTQQGFKLLEELDLPHQAQGRPRRAESQITRSKLEKELSHAHQLVASEEIAGFDEILLHYCNVKCPGTLKSFNIWVSSVDAKECDLGSFHVDLSEMIFSGNLKSIFGGKAMTLHYISNISF
ncbi:hypothetical protein MRB53_022977 [Persea americana]|uniref:Uncharacterized protein n=1 Tax=Persea americana TaxID=3435 RepID=A0ACC2L9D3_PERAE|nr:hypothetical protein MRB53_022977 [Persea americana]